MKNILKVFAFISVFGLALTLAACNKTKTTKTEGTTTNGATTTVTGTTTEAKHDITVSFEQTTVEMNEWETVTVAVSSSDGSPVALEVSDKTKLYIKGNKITGLAPGTVTLTAISTVDPEAKATLEVVIKENAENRPVLSLTEKDATYVSQSYSLNPKLKGVEDGTYTVEYTVENGDVASVDENGVVKALKVGSTTVKATTKYRSVTFECTATITVGARVVFLPEAATAALKVSEFYTGTDAVATVNGKDYAITNGEIELALSDFDLSSATIYDASIGNFNFKVIIFALEGAKVYQGETELVKDADGYKVNTEAEADSNGLHWITFDPSEERISAGYDVLEVTFKYDDVSRSQSAGIVAGVLGEYGYGYLFGYKYGNDTWVYFDNDYVDGPTGKVLGYFAAIRISAGAPYDYGYVRLYDKETGDLLIDYYHLEITDNSGSHGNWSGYCDALVAGKEYILEIDCSKTGDITMSGFDKAVITNVEWKMKAETEISYKNEEVSLNLFESVNLMPQINDDSLITLELSDESLFFIEGNKAYAVKAGTCVVTATANGKTATMTVTVTADADKMPVVDFSLPVETLEVGRTLDLTAKLTINGEAMNSSLYEVSFSTESTALSVYGWSIKATAAGTATVTCTITIFEQEFKKDVTITLTDAEAQDDPSVGRVYQLGTEIKPNAEGKYLVDTTKDGDGSGRRWLVFDTEKLTDYSYLRMTVKFNSWFNINAGCVSSGCGIYHYHWGFNFSNVQFFWDNEYSSGGFGGSVGPDGSANREHYFAIYNTDGTEVLNCLETSGWTAYKTLELNKEYILLFNVAAMGDSFRIAGFDGAEISDIKWLTSTNLELGEAGPTDPIDPPVDPVDPPVDPVDPPTDPVDLTDPQAHIYQNGTEIVANESGKYVVDTTKDADSNGLRWLTFDAAKLANFNYLKMTVKFSAWTDRDASVAAPTCNIYKYSFGWNFKDVKFFWDNTYSSGGFGGSNGPDGSANREHLFAIYDTDGNVVINCLESKGWTSYATLELNKEYIFLFNVKAMGENFTIAGFDNAEFSNIKWLETTDLGLTPTDPVDPPVDPVDPPVDPVDPPVDPVDLTDPQAHIYQGETEIKANAEGKYVVDTTKDADGSGRRFLTFDTAKLENFSYLKMTVKFNSFFNITAGCVSTGCGQYNYHWGFNYSNVQFFWENDYKDGGFGGAVGSNGNADREHYFAIYDVNGNVVLDCLTTKGWTAYRTLELNKEYIFLFNVKAMGDSFKIAGFDGAEISDITWLKTTNLNPGSEPEPEPIDTTDPVAHLYQGTTEIVANEAGKYVVDTTQAADSNGLRWITFDYAKLENFNYLKMTVKFSAWTDRDASVAAPTCNIYKYSFGWNFKDVKFFYDNTYSSGGFGGSNGPDGSANREHLFAIYDTNGNVVLDCLSTKGWTAYATLELNKEYIFLFNAKAMENLSIAGFDNAEISNVKWLKTTSLELDRELTHPQAHLYQNGTEIVANENGKYVVDTTQAADSNGLRWLTADTEKAQNFKYLKMTVKFSAWTDRDASVAAPTCNIYKYSFGWNFKDVKFFYDNTYSSGGFGGSNGPDGSANREHLFAIYDTNGNVVLDCLTTKGWTAYATLELNKEYVFVFDIQSMGEGFTLAGFDNAEFSNITWTNTL